MKGHTTEACRSLKDKIQNLIDTKVIHLKEPTPNVANNPLPRHEINMLEVGESVYLEESIWFAGEERMVSMTAHAPFVVQRQAPFEVEVAAPKLLFEVFKAPEVRFDTHEVPWSYDKGKAKVEEADVAQGVTRSGRIYTSDNAIRGSSSKTKTPTVEVEENDVLKQVQAKGYSVADQLSKIPAQVSILSLLQTSELHQKALMKVLNEAYVPANITDGEVAHMVGQVFEAYKISFHDDELPPEGASHNRPLYITLQYHDKMISKALVDPGSGLNICPLGVITRLGVDVSKIKTWKMNVKAFDGSQRDTIGEITLDMVIGPATFPIVFQVMDIPASYNLLLGRPWIHMARAVPSTLHQCLKFEWDHEEVVVHGEKGHPVYAVEERSYLNGEMFHTMELVGSTEPWYNQKVLSMLRRLGYELGKGLGAKLQGLTEPIIPNFRKDTIGIGYEGLPKKSGTFKLRHPLPPLYQTFRSAGFLINKVEEEEDVLESLRNLFIGEDLSDLIFHDGERSCNVVINEEGAPMRSKEAAITISSWTTTPSRPRRALG